MGDVLEVHQVRYLRQRLCGIVEQRYQLEGGIELNPLRGRQVGDGAGYLREILRRDAELVGIEGHLALRPCMLLGQ